MAWLGNCGTGRAAARMWYLLGGGAEDGGRRPGVVVGSGLLAAAASCLDGRESDSWIGLAENWLPRLVQMVLFSSWFLEAGLCMTPRPQESLKSSLLCSYQEL